MSFSTYSGDVKHSNATGRMQPHGRGRAVLPSGLQYEGEFRNGFPHGVGRFEDPSGFSYEGDVERGPMNGRGRKRRPDGYEFEVCLWAIPTIVSCLNHAVQGDDFRDGELYGKGTCYKPGTLVYSGDFDRDRFQGKGRLTSMPNRNVVEGQFAGNLPHGVCTLRPADGPPRRDVWINGIRSKVGFGSPAAGP